MTFTELLRELQQGAIVVSGVTEKAYALVELDKDGHPIAGANMTEAEIEGEFTIDTVRDLVINLDDDAI